MTTPLSPRGRRRLLAALLVLPPVAAFAADPSRAQSAGLDFWNLPWLEQETAAMVESGRRLEAEDSEVQQRIRVKEVLVADLIAGRASLGDVASRFLVLNEARPGYVELIRSRYPGDTDLEKSARNVIDFARSRVADPAERERLVRRLEADLTRMSRPAPADVH